MNARKKFAILLFFTFTVLLVGCRKERATGFGEYHPINSETPTVEPSNSLPITTTNLPITRTSTPNSTSATTVTITQAGTRTPPPTRIVPIEAQLLFQCIQISPDLPSGANSNGVLVMKSHISIGEGYEKSESYMLDMATVKFMQITGQDEKQIYHVVSPNRKLMAYESIMYNTENEIIMDELVIATADGQRLKAIPWEDGWTDLPGWLDDERLVLHIPNLKPDVSVIEQAATFLVLNPFTGERQILQPNFPGIYDLSPIPYLEGWSITRYNPNLSRVVYLRSAEKGKQEFALWDMEDHKLLASWDFILSVPRWSQDGSRLVVESVIKDKTDLELFLVSRDGTIEQLTNLNAYSRTIHLNYSWSPDGRYIATWTYKGDVLNLPNNREAELIIIDTNTRMVTDTCIRVKYQGEGYGGGAPPIHAPIWSPDGKQLVVMDWYERDHRRVILVDPWQGFAAQIAEDMEPVGWMLTP